MDLGNVSAEEVDQLTSDDEVKAEGSGSTREGQGVILHFCCKGCGLEAEEQGCVFVWVLLETSSDTSN